MRIIAWMVVKNDAYYLPMALQSIIPYVDGIYIQDQMSSDGTTEIIKYFMMENVKECKIYTDIVDTGIKNRFDAEYNEPKYRSMAVQNAEAIFDVKSPDLLLKIDADEIYTPLFFEKIKELENPLKDGLINGIKVSGDRFISKSYRTASPHAIQYSPTGGKFYDPHTQIWSSRIKVRYEKNPGQSGYFHCIHTPDPQPVYWLEGICNIHLHRTFGPKCYDFWSEGGDVFKTDVPFNAREMAPKWFYSDINFNTAEKVDYQFPDYVLRRWEEFGIWD